MNDWQMKYKPIMSLMQVDTSLRRRAGEKGMRIKKFIIPLNTRLFYSSPAPNDNTRTKNHASWIWRCLICSSAWNSKCLWHCRIQTLRYEGGPGSSRPWDKRGTRSPKNFFRPFGPEFGLKIRREAAGPPGSCHGSATAFSWVSTRLDESHDSWLIITIQH